MDTKKSNKILNLIKVKKKFGHHIVHRGVSFGLAQGESLGLLGASGTGKSVLLRSIIGLDFIDSGMIYYNSERIDQFSEKQYFLIRKEISYNFQSGALFDSINVFENLAYPLYEHTSLSYKEITKKVEYYLDLIDLKGSEELMPSDLSGGMKKRVGMARAMILNPKIVLYDEPTAGLDPINTKRIVSVMKHFKDLNQSSIFVTHDIPSAMKLCDRIVMLKDGRTMFDGPTIDFKNSKSQEIIQFVQQEKNYVQKTE